MADFDANMLQADAASVFCNDTVGYKPKGGTSRNIPAHVFRDIPREVAAGSNVSAPYLEVFIPNNTDTTKGTPSIVVGGDTITVSDREGGTARERTIEGIISQDPGGWMLKLR